MAPYNKVPFIQTLRQSQQQHHYTSTSASSDDGDSSSENLMEKFPRELYQPKSFWRRYRTLLLSHAASFTIYAIVLFLVASSPRQDPTLGGVLPWSPAKQAVSWSEQVYGMVEDMFLDKSKYSGHPRPELDQAWHDLLLNVNVRIPIDTIKFLGREKETVLLPEGDGYMGTLNVYHELHCIKRLHQYMYKEHYFADLSAEDLEMNRLHNEHCLDYLRKAIMCHGDTGLVTYYWDPDSRSPLARATSHSCVNWEGIEKWADARRLDVMKPGYLVHPTLGLAYPGGHGNRIGAVHHHGGGNHSLPV